MTHKEFLTEVQHRSGLDRQICSALMQSAVKLMAEQATEQITVEWEGIGTFVATKHPEYVAEDPESGLQTMYPPRITYRLSQQDSSSPNFKGLNATQFKFHLARYAKATEGDAEYFMHMVCKSILEHLDQNDPVEIQGLGTFSWVESQQGRRMSLQVDEKMRSLVNAPFACFEPMVVAAEAKKTEVEKVEEEQTPEPEPVSAEEPVEEMSVEVAEAPVVVAEEPAEVEESVSVEESVEEAPEESVEEAAEEPAVIEEPTPVVEETPAEEIPSTEPSAPVKEEPVPAPSPKRRREPEPSLMDKIQPMIDQLLALPKNYLYGGVAGVVLLLVLIVWLLIPSKSEESKLSETQTEQYTIQRDLDEEVEEGAEAEEAKSAETKSAEAKPAVTKPTEAKPVAAKPAVTKPAPKPAPSAAPSRGSKPTNDMLLMENGEPQMDKLGEGGRLTLLALRHYGDKAFWAYIYDVNAYQLGNPNNVPVGKSLYLPNPTYFKIDASDPSSIKRAQNRAMQILREWE